MAAIKFTGILKGFFKILMWLLLGLVGQAASLTGLCRT